MPAGDGVWQEIDHWATGRGAVSIRLGCRGRFFGEATLDKVLKSKEKLDERREGDIHRCGVRTGENMEAPTQPGSLRVGVPGAKRLQGGAVSWAETEPERPFGPGHQGFTPVSGHRRFLAE